MSEGSGEVGIEESRDATDEAMSVLLKGVTVEACDEATL